MNNSEAAVTLVVGLGEVGKPLFTILKEQEPEAIGIDIKPMPVNQSVGILHICFPFINADQFRSAVEGYAIKFSPSVIVINSTIVPGTTRSIERSTGIPCVYSPVRGKHTKMVEELQHYVKFVAGTDAQATARVQAHFKAAGILSLYTHLDVYKRQEEERARHSLVRICRAVVCAVSRYGRNPGAHTGSKWNSDGTNRHLESGIGDAHESVARHRI